MQAFTDLSINGNFSGGDVYGAPASSLVAQPHNVVNGFVSMHSAAYEDYHPTHPASVYSAPVIIPSAAVGANPWDTTFGPIGIMGAGAINVPALVLPAQVGSSSFA